MEKHENMKNDINETTDKDEKHIPDTDLDMVAGGTSYSYKMMPLQPNKLAASYGAFRSLKVDPRLGDWIVNGACDCCKWEPAIV